ncbi:MAG: hypothetical protein ABSD71_09580 [Bacteroidales bacterium]|jgi:hypothetical protein
MERKIEIRKHEDLFLEIWISEKDDQTWLKESIYFEKKGETQYQPRMVEYEEKKIHQEIIDTKSIQDVAIFDNDLLRTEIERIEPKPDYSMFYYNYRPISQLFEVFYQKVGDIDSSWVGCFKITSHFLLHHKVAHLLPISGNLHEISKAYDGKKSNSVIYQEFIKEFFPELDFKEIKRNFFGLR